MCASHGTYYLMVVTCSNTIWNRTQCYHRWYVLESNPIPFARREITPRCCNLYKYKSWVQVTYTHTRTRTVWLEMLSGAGIAPFVHDWVRTSTWRVSNDGRSHEPGSGNGPADASKCLEHLLLVEPQRCIPNRSKGLYSISVSERMQV
jgi:hypothetical protein